MEPLATWLAQCMKEQELSQDRLAEKSGVSQATISFILRGDHIPRPDSLRKLADYFQVSIFFVYQLAGLLPPNIDVPSADPKAIATLEEVLSLMDDWPPDVQERFLDSVRSQAAAVQAARGV